jgi:hypothetical protein
MTTHKVGYLIGSLAKESINRKLAKALVRLAPPELEMSEISFKDLPLYSYDFDADFPPAGKAFKAAIAAVDAVLFVTPEFHTGRAEERDRLGEPPVWRKLIHAKAVGRHRHLARRNRHGGRPAEPAQCA